MRSDRGLFTFVFLSCFFCLSSNVLSFKEASSSEPYISGDSFRAHADFVIDFKAYGASEVDKVNKQGEPFVPHMVQRGDVVFVNGDLLAYFFSIIHPAIRNPYILLTHNSDFDIPGCYREYLDDAKIIAWFGQNKALNHPKLHALPIGFSNNHWPHGNTNIIRQVQSSLGLVKKNKLAYLNIRVWTNSKVRSEVAQLFANKAFCFKASDRNFKDYLSDLASSMFVISPRGNGLDTHRTWEALLMGSFPIVQSSPMDSAFDGLPVVIINNWREVTKDFLERKYKELTNKSYNVNALYLDYWLEKIRIIQSQYR